MKRKHVRTRQSTVNFQKGSKLDQPRILEPGVYRMFSNGSYYASFIIHKDQTVEFYGHNLDVRAERSWHLK